MPAKKKDTRVIAIGLLLILITGAYFIGRSIVGAKRANENSYNALIPKSEQVPYPTVTAESLQKIVHSPDENYVLIDIRPKEAFQLSHIPSSFSYPDTGVEVAAIPAGKKIIIIGSDADLSLNTAVANWLESKSYAYAFLQGGYGAWTALNEQAVTTGDPKSFVDQSKVTYISPAELKTALQNKEQFFLLDVQTADNYHQGHLQGAVNIPLAELESRINEVPRGEKIVVYGNNAAESFQGGNLLFDLNVFSARVLSGDTVLQGGTDLYLEKAQ